MRSCSSGSLGAIQGAPSARTKRKRMKPPPATTLASLAHARTQFSLARGAATAVTGGSAWLRRAKRGIRDDGTVYLQHPVRHCERSEAIHLATRNSVGSFASSVV